MNTGSRRFRGMVVVSSLVASIVLGVAHPASAYDPPIILDPITRQLQIANVNILYAVAVTDRDNETRIYLGVPGVPVNFSVPTESPSGALPLVRPMQRFTAVGRVAFEGANPIVSIELDRVDGTLPVGTALPVDAPLVQEPLCDRVVMSVTFSYSFVDRSVDLDDINPGDVILAEKVQTYSFGFRAPNAPQRFVADEVKVSRVKDNLGKEAITVSGPDRHPARLGIVPACGSAPPPIQLFGQYETGGGLGLEGEGYRLTVNNVPQPYNLDLDITHSTTERVDALHRPSLTAFSGKIAGSPRANVQLNVEKLGRKAGSLFQLSVDQLPSLLNLDFATSEGITDMTRDKSFSLQLNAHGQRVGVAVAKARIDDTAPYTSGGFDPARSATFRLEGLPTGRTNLSVVEESLHQPATFSATYITYSSQGEPLDYFHGEGGTSSGSPGAVDRFAYELGKGPATVPASLTGVLTAETVPSGRTNPDGTAVKVPRKTALFTSSSAFPMTITTTKSGKRTTTAGDLPAGRFYLCSIEAAGCAPEIEKRSVEHQTGVASTETIALTYSRTLRLEAAGPSSVRITEEDDRTGAVMSSLHLTSFSHFAIAVPRSAQTSFKDGLALDTNQRLAKGHIATSDGSLSFDDGIAAQDYGIFLFDSLYDPYDVVNSCFGTALHGGKDICAVNELELARYVPIVIEL